MCCTAEGEIGRLTRTGNVDHQNMHAFLTLTPLIVILSSRLAPRRVLPHSLRVVPAAALCSGSGWSGARRGRFGDSRPVRVVVRSSPLWVRGTRAVELEAHLRQCASGHALRRVSTHMQHAERLCRTKPDITWRSSHQEGSERHIARTTKIGMCLFMLAHALRCSDAVSGRRNAAGSSPGRAAKPGGGPGVLRRAHRVDRGPKKRGILTGEIFHRDVQWPRLKGMLASALRRAGSGVLRNNAAMMAPRAAGGVAMGADRRRYNHPGQPETMWATTILSVRKGNKVVVIGDGQVTQGHFVVKDNARKVRRLQNGNVITGFAGAAVDALTLFDRLEGKLEQYPQLMRACVELAKEWRSDKSLRRALNAVLIVADKDITLSISGRVAAPQQ